MPEVNSDGGTLDNKQTKADPMPNSLEVKGHIATTSLSRNGAYCLMTAFILILFLFSFC